MLTEQQIRDLGQARARILIPGMTLGVLAVFAYFGFLGVMGPAWASELAASMGLGKELQELARVAMILPAFIFFLAPSIIAESRSQKYAVRCPHCEKDVTRSTARILATRSCPGCEKQIVKDGRVRSERVYQRFTDRRTKRFLQAWLWIWPVLGMCLIAVKIAAPSWLHGAPMAGLFPPLLGALIAGWAYVRTWDRRYLPPAIVCSILLASLALIS